MSLQINKTQYGEYHHATGVALACNVAVYTGIFSPFSEINHMDMNGNVPR